MAVQELGSIKFEAIANYMSNGNPQAGPTFSYSENQNDNKSLYINDTTSQEFFPKYVGQTNPAYFNMGKLDAGSLENNTFEQVNKFKTVDLLFRNGVSAMAGASLVMPSLDNSSWGSWRNTMVDPSIYLWLSDPKIGYSFTHEYQEAWKGLQEKSSVKKIEGALEIARGLGLGSGDTPSGGKFKSKYSKVPAWKDTTAIEFRTDLKFDFQFGRYGLFSGEHEVVRPILALASAFALQTKNDPRYVFGPAPTMESYMVSMIQNVGDSVSSAVSSTVDSLVEGAQNAFSNILDKDDSATEATTSTDSVGNIVDILTNLQRQLYTSIDNSIERALPDLTLFFVRFGRMINGPFYAKSVNWDFDFSQVDDYGFPWKGSITIGGLESPLFPTPDNFAKIFNSGVS